MKEINPHIDAAMARIIERLGGKSMAPADWASYSENFAFIREELTTAIENTRREAIGECIKAVEKLLVDQSFECHCMCCGNCEHPEESDDFNKCKAATLSALTSLRGGTETHDCKWNPPHTEEECPETDFKRPTTQDKE